MASTNDIVRSSRAARRLRSFLELGWVSQGAQSFFEQSQLRVDCWNTCRANGWRRPWHRRRVHLSNANRRLARAATSGSPRTNHPISANNRPARKPGEDIVAIDNFEPRLAQLSFDNAWRNVMFLDLLF